jgi:hypothetical protein
MCFGTFEHFVLRSERYQLTLCDFIGHCMGRQEGHPKTGLDVTLQGGDGVGVGLDLN